LERRCQGHFGNDKALPVTITKGPLISVEQCQSLEKDEEGTIVVGMRFTKTIFKGTSARPQHRSRVAYPKIVELEQAVGPWDYGGSAPPPVAKVTGSELGICCYVTFKKREGTSSK
jgi:hypothetical protein